MMDSSPPVLHPFDAIFYDLDGTLADSCEGIEWAARQALGERWPEHTSGPLRHLIGPPIRAIFGAALREQNVEFEEGDLDALEKRYRALYDSEGCSRATAFSGVREGLERRQVLGLRQFVVTNKPKAPTQRMLRALELADFIEEVGSPDTREPRFASKGEAARWLLQKHNLVASQVLFVGDARDDALAAQAIGARFVAVSWGYGAAHEIADAPVWKVARHFSEVDALLAEARVRG
jgi:phosphoglycolate phosphatase